MIRRRGLFTFNVGSFAVAAALVLVGCGGCQVGEQIPESQSLTIGIATWAGFGTGIVGMEKGHFGSLVVKTRVLDDSTARHAAFLSGDLDIMISSVDLYAQEAAGQITGQAFLVTDESVGGDGIVVSDDIRTVADLRGKRVAFNRGGPSDYLLYKALADNGVGLDEVVQVEVDDPSRAGDAFLGGAVDAAVTWEPFLSQVVESGKGHILLTTADYPDIIVDILVASDELAANEELLSHFMDGWLRAVQFIEQNPDEAAEIMSAGLNLPVEDVVGMMAGLRYAGRERNAHFFDSADPSRTHLADIFTDAGRYWVDTGITEVAVPAVQRISSMACEFFGVEE